MNKLSSNFGTIVEQLRRSTVLVSNGGGTGSGLIIGSDGTIVTNAHVVHSTQIEVQLWDGRAVPALLKAKSSDRDLALLSIPLTELPAAVFGDSSSVQPGDSVVAVGNPLGFIGAASVGVVHSLGPARGMGPTHWVQCDIRLAPGSSGGPLADAEGRVIGLNAMITDRAALAIPGNSVNRFAATEENRERLGVVVHPVSVTIDGHNRFGLAILQIAAGSPAEAASLMPGDIVLGIEGRPLDTLEDFEGILGGNGERVIRLLFIRGERSNIRKVSLVLGAKKRTAA